MVYVGLDLSRTRLDVHVMDESGAPLAVTTAAPDRGGLAVLFGAGPELTESLNATRVTATVPVAPDRDHGEAAAGPASTDRGPDRRIGAGAVVAAAGSLVVQAACADWQEIAERVEQLRKRRSQLAERQSQGSTTEQAIEAHGYAEQARD
jgi:hypothetical protein